MGAKDFISKHAVSILLIVLGCVLTFLTFIATVVPLWIIGLIIVIAGILQFLDKQASDQQFSSAVTSAATSIGELNQKVGDLSKQNQEQKKTSDEQLQLVKNMNSMMGESQKIRMNLVARLIERGLISESDVVKHLEGMDAYLLYCYANPPPIASGKDVIKRSYPVFLQEAGFVRMGTRSTFFITTANRLTKKLQNPNTLKRWLLTELKVQLEADWKAQLEKLKAKGSILYERHKDTDFSKFLSMDLLIFKTKLGSGNIGIINKNILPAEFSKLVGTDLKPGKLEIEEGKKIEVKKFIFESSFQLFFAEIPKDDLRKLNKLEAKLKHELKINSFIDYTVRSVGDITKIFQESFDAPKALEYSTLLKTKAAEYENALKEMGISTT